MYFLDGPFALCVPEMNLNILGINIGKMVGFTDGLILVCLKYPFFLDVIGAPFHCLLP